MTPTHYIPFQKLSQICDSFLFHILFELGFLSPHTIILSPKCVLIFDSCLTIRIIPVFHFNKNKVFYVEHIHL